MSDEFSGVAAAILGAMPARVSAEVMVGREEPLATLLSALASTREGDGRVVVVGSIAHRQAPPGGIQFDNLSGKGWERQAYGHSKLANGLFSLELSKRLAGTRATSNSLHPGVVATNIMRNTNFRGGGTGWETPAQGAATSCYLASNPKLARVTGQYFADCNPADQSDYQKDPAMAAKLWQVSTELTRPYLA